MEPQPAGKRSRPDRGEQALRRLFRKSAPIRHIIIEGVGSGERAGIGVVSGDESLTHRAYFSILIMACTIVVGSAYAGPGTPIRVHTGLAPDSIAALIDRPEEPSVVRGTGDFNRDGIADMVEATPAEGKDSSEQVLAVRLGRADGTYTSVASHNVIGADARALVVGDFNADGNPDVIVARGDGAILEFLGDGRGNMAKAGNIAALGSIASMAVGHFTRSGNLDLVVSDVRSNSAVILLGGGDGSFRITWSFQLPRLGKEFHIATADFNKDGIADLVITSEDDEDYEVMLGSGSGTFTEAPELSHIRDPNTYCPS